MSIRNEWKELIQAAENLELDGQPLEVQLDNEEALKYAVIALIIHSSQLEAQGAPWRFALDVQGQMLCIYKMSASVAKDGS